MSLFDPTNYLDNSNDELKFTDEVYSTHIYEKDKIINNFVIFKECTFKNSFILENIKGNDVGLHFNNCTFQEEASINECDFSIITFADCRFESKDLKLKSNKSEILVIRGLKGDTLYVNGQYDRINTLELNLKKFILKDVNQEYKQNESIITFDKNNIDNLTIEVSSLHSKLTFANGKYNWITFDGLFNNSILFEEKLKIENMVFESSVFNDRIDINNGDYQYINFYRSSFKGLIWINGYDVLDKEEKELFIKNLNLHSNNFDKNVSVSLPDIEEINLSNNEFKKLFSFYSEITESTLDTYDVRVRINGTNQGNIVIKDSKIDLDLGGINLGNISFKNVIIFSLLVSDFQNNGNVTFSNILDGVYFTIVDSSIGKMDFLNTDFKVFKEIVISDSSIEKANFSDFPTRIRSYSSNPKIGYGIKDKSLSSLNLKNVYNQLKKSAKSKGDIDMVNKYQSLEYRYLLYKKGFGFDKLLLFLNWISNNHGRSWFQGVLFTLLIGLLCFFTYMSVIGVEIVSPDFFKSYIVFISSFPKLELERYSELPKTWDISLIIWLSRIFISYGIYQTVAAFRKYGKG